MKKHKFKINESTTLEDIKKELEFYKNATIQTIQLSDVRKIANFLGAEEIRSTGSSVRFYHEILEKHPFYHGYFQIHKIHKGGNVDKIRKRDFVKYLLPPLEFIIENSHETK